MKFSFSILFILASLVALTACTPDSTSGVESTEARNPVLPAQADQLAATPAQDTGIAGNIDPATPAVNQLLAADIRSVRQIMNEDMEMNARAIWDAVSYIVTADGVEERFPQTDADWNALLQAATALMRGGEALMVDGRPVDPGFDGTGWPDWQYTPPEIELVRSDDPDTWRYYLVDMQGAISRIIDTINRRDLLTYTELGATLNQACQGCHGTFWYRPLNQVP